MAYSDNIMEYGVCCVADTSIKDIFPSIDNFSYTDYICALTDIQKIIFEENYNNEDNFLYLYYKLYAELKAYEEKHKDYRWGVNANSDKIYTLIDDNHAKIQEQKPKPTSFTQLSEPTKKKLTLIDKKCRPTKLKKYSLIGSITLIIILCILYLYKNMDNFLGGTHNNFTYDNKSNKKLYKTLNKIYTNKIIDY